MNAVVVAPYRADAVSYHAGVVYGPRSRNWAYAYDVWRQLGWPITAGTHEGDPFNRARARNIGARHAEPWDVCLFVDADIVLHNLDQARRAAQLAHDTGRLVYAHDHLIMTTEFTRNRILQGVPPPEAAADSTRHPNTWSSALAVPRPLWEAVGGYDERFEGWGWEDLAFMACCTTLGGGYERVPGDAYHLWHPRTRADNEDNPHHAANWALGDRYFAARGNVSAMRALIAERG